MFMLNKISESESESIIVTRIYRGSGAYAPEKFLIIWCS